LHGPERGPKFSNSSGSLGRVTFALARSLLIADAVTPEALGRALLLSASRGASLVWALLAANAIEPSRLEQILQRGEAPSMRHIAPVASLVQRLPPGLCERLLALPVRRDPRTGTVDVAVVDALDEHAAGEISYWLKAPVRVVRTSLASMETALRRVDWMPEHGMRPLAPPMGEPVLPELATGSEQDEEPLTGPNIPIPLTRRSLPPTSGHVGSPAPSTQRGPFPPAAAAPAPDSTSVIIEKMHEAQDRDTILELLVSGVGAVARSVVVLAIRRDAINGWAGSQDIRDRARLRDLRMPLTTRTALSEGLDHEGIRLVTLPDDDVHAPLAALLGIAPATAVALGAVRVDGRPAVVVVAAGFGDSVRAMSHMADLTPAAGESLARLLRDRRK